MNQKKKLSLFLSVLIISVLFLTNCAKNIGGNDFISSSPNQGVKSSCSNSILSSNQYLYGGQSINSCDGRFSLIMQGDGNLVLYQQGKALWASNTSGNSGAFAVMQGDGNFVIYNGSRAVWASGTNTSAGAFVFLQDDGNLVIYKDGSAKWATMTFSSSIESGQIIKPGVEITSLNRLLRLIMQGDGNLVLYFENKPIWSSNTYGNSGAYAVMQSDGNFVIYNNSRAIWASGTNGNSGANVAVQDDGNLTVLKGTSVKWNSNTSISILKAGQSLNGNEKLYSKNLNYKVIMQGDGNLVMYKNNKACWATGTDNHGGAYAVMQSDGNFVVYQNSSALWNSGTGGNSGAYIAMQDDGNLVIYKDGSAKWASNTAGCGESVVVSGYSVTIPYHKYTVYNGINYGGVVITTPTQGIANGIAAGFKYLGWQYVWGGGDANGPTLGIHDWGVADSYGDYNRVGFDCAGLTQYVAARYPANIPGYSYAQRMDAPKKIAWAQALPGDLVGYDGHITVFLGVIGGKRMQLESPQSGDFIKVSTVRSDADSVVYRWW